LALALQIGLSFGHVHGIHPDHPRAVAGAVPDDNAGLETQAPDGDDDHDSHYCAIYAINALLSGAQVAIAPGFALPVAPAAPKIANREDALDVAPRHLAFRSRAPPLS
jgi:hypothetical protein